MIIYIDSNVFFDDPYLAKSTFSIILEKVRNSNGVIKMPEVVYSETLNNLLNKNISEARDGLRKPDKHITKYLAGSGLEEKYKLPILDDAEITTSFHNRYDELTTEGVLEIINHNTIDKDYLLNDIMHRALNCIRPFSAGKEEFKDTIIWHTVIEDIKQNEYTKCFFISNNNSDFFEKNSVDNKTETASFHKDLLKDIPEGVQLLPLRSLNNLIEETKDMFEPQNDVSLKSEDSEGVGVTIEYAFPEIDLNEEYVEGIVKKHLYDDFQTFFVQLFKMGDGQFSIYFPLIAPGVGSFTDIEKLYEAEILIRINRITNLSAFKINDSIKVVCSVHATALMNFMESSGSYSLEDYEDNEFIASVSFSIDNNQQINDFDTSGISRSRF